MTLYEKHKLKCAKRGIKIVRDSFDSNDENLKKELEMLNEVEQLSFLQKMEGNWGYLLKELLPVIIPFVILFGFVVWYW